MKRYGRLWPDVVAFDNLLLAYRKARKGKRQRDEVARFSLNLEHELLGLQKVLSDGNYQPGDYRHFTIYERKPRLISAAPFRDRVVHHALMNVVEPLLDKSFIFDSYACRKDKGVHAAVDRYQSWARRYTYTLKLDVASYFPSIDRRILKQQIRSKIKDAYVLALFEQIIDHAAVSTPQYPSYFPGDNLLTPQQRPTGLPIGNLTSQVLANLYLNGLDHFVKEKLRAPAYLRYVDDILLLGDSRSQLWEWQSEIAGYLEQLRLRLHPRKINLFRTSCGVDVFGYRVFPGFRLLRNDNGHRFHRKLRGFARAYHSGSLDWDEINPRVQSWIGHSIHADTFGLRSQLFNSVCFTRGQGSM